MNESEVQRIKSLSTTNPELQRLYTKHCEYEQRLVEIQGSKWQSPAEYAEAQKLKRQKLAGRDRIVTILAQHQ